MKTLSKYLNKYLQSLFILLTCSIGSSSLLFAQQDGTPYAVSLTRYVATATDGGAYANDGKSWTAPKNYLQDAINDLHQFMVKEGITEGGRIFVKAGTYTPTESTEQNADGVLYTSFKIYEGITVYGGFSSANEEDPKDRPLKPGAQYNWDLAHETVLSGGHVSSPCTFTWNETKQEYDALFPGNSYHVVWFATNGFDQKPGTEQRARKLNHPAGVDGCVIEGGNASHASLTVRRHTAYGGGAYMVENSFIRNSVFRKNSAKRRGGAAYLDGGGLLQDCYLHTNQCAGVGGFEGYGGAVAIDQNGRAEHCVMVNNMARIGGGIALAYIDPRQYPFDSPLIEMDNQSQWPNPYVPAAVGCLVANNTSSQEAGGIFFNQGGTANRLTIVNNRCNGEDVIIDKIRYGRSGGAYILKCGTVFNSVLWGGTVKNQNVQMAVYDPKTDAQYQLARVGFSALQNHDLVDWSAVNKRGAFNLETQNSIADAASANRLSDAAYPEFTKPSGKAGVLAESADYLLTYNWKPKSLSALRQRSVQVSDLPSALETRAYRHAETLRDLFEQPYAPRGVLGAYAADQENIKPYQSGQTLTLFVDPSRQTMQPDAQGNVGGTWDNPLNNLNRALSYFREHHAQNGTMRILVKEGILYTTGNFYNTHIRSSNIDMVEGVEVYGGYAQTLTGTDESGRNPLEHITRITGDITEDAYANNVCHLISFNDINHAVLDGFFLSHANAVSRVGFETDEDLNGRPAFQHGGGVICRNTVGKKNMTGNVVRNCVISNCTALLGSAVYVCAESGTTVDLKMVNCVIHNNESVIEAPFNKVQATVYVEAKGTGQAHLDFLHSDIIKNVGHPLVTQGTAAQVELTNSVVWANASEALASTELLETQGTKLLRLGDISSKNNILNVTGSYCCLDKGTSIAALTETQAILTYKNTQDIVKTYPDFINPTKNIGVTEHGDATFYGGTPDFTPTNLSPLVNAASEGISEGTDFAGEIRSYGGLPDVGALENIELPLKGKVIYVRDFGPGRENDKGGNGSSWSQAINGNCTAYENNHQFEGVEAMLYPEGYGLTGLQWAVDEAYKRSLSGYADKSSFVVNDVTEKVYCEPGGDFGQKTQHPARTIRVGQVDQNNLVQVWVAQGEYLRREGFFMRDGVDVFGGFPTIGNPGMRERSPKQYETIIETNTTKEADSPSVKWGLPRGSCNQRDYGSVSVQTVSEFDKTQWKIEGVCEGRNMSSGNLGALIDNGPSATSFTLHSGKSCEIIIDFSNQVRFDHIICDKFVFGRTSHFRFYTSSDKTHWNELYYRYVGNKGSGSGDEIDWTMDFPLQTARYLKLSVITDSWFDNDISLKELSLAHGRKIERYYDLNAYKNAYAGQRVLTQPFPYYARNQINATDDNNKASWESIEYHNIPLNSFSRLTTWNGFTIQNGRTRISHQRDGGAGVALRHNGRIENCVVKNNYNKGRAHVRGGGIFCNGGEIVNCVIDNNILDTDAAALGGGLYLRLGTVYNTCLSNNRTLKNSSRSNTDDFDGTAVFFENGVFYNNTISKNVGYHALKTGNWFENGKIEIYNSIIYGNDNGGDAPKDLVAHTSFGKVEKCLFADKSKYEPTSVVDPQKQIIGDPKFVDAAHNVFTLQTNSPAINAGDNSPGGITLPTFDANYDDRIQDCTVDIGAFETNTAYAISGTVKDGYYTYYVAQTGLGTASASSPETRACSEKLQLVLDAAGRYKQAHPTEKVRVCLAGDGQGTQKTGFSYHPTRSVETDETSRRYENPRSYSLVVPRGVEVWGGYSGDFTKRDIVKYPSRFSGEYQSEFQRVRVYHTVTFTEQIFDDKQKPIADKTLTQVTGRAVLDGLFLLDGEASGEGLDEMYGGAAIVPEYAHVRNCILLKNGAAKGGGALYLQPGALVSGCLFTENEAKDGGAVYVEPLEKDVTMTRDKLSHIYTSTLVNNKARKAGGGIYFLNNVYVNSSIVWQNQGSSQANISGRFEYSEQSFKDGVIPETGLYPFAYSAVENMRLPGTNNQSVATENDKGVRFENVKNDAYYGLTDYSVLLHTGMPITTYATLVTEKGLNGGDFMQKARTGGEIDDNFYIDAGARSLGKRSIEMPAAGKVLKRLFVTHPDLIDMKVADIVRKNYNVNNLNTHQGGSFAYPMQHLDDALRYIHNARANQSIPDEQKKNFEIYISAGTFYPTYSYVEGKPVPGASRENTFLVPDGTTLIGGIDPNDTERTGYYCQLVPTEGNPGSFDDVTIGNATGGTVKMKPVTKEMAMEHRKWYDMNSNDIFEPWEMRFQTILSGHNPNLKNDNNVYHVISVIPPKPKDQTNGELPIDFSQSVILDGLQIMEGSAWDDKAQDETKFMGGGLYFNGVTKNEVGQVVRDLKIPMVVRHCRFTGNMAGQGGAIYTNAPLAIYSSSFEQNMAISRGADKHLGGYGSAVYVKHSRVDFVNSLFANNEARSQEGQAQSAGTIMVGENGKTAMLNCNMVNNLADIYPAVYSQEKNTPQVLNNVLLNSIFWGNKAKDETQVKHHYVINFDNPNLEQAQEALWFCAYENGCGKEPVLNEDFRKKELNMSPTDFSLPNVGELLKDQQDISNNCNIYLNSDNYALDGPNFTNPSLGAGTDYFMVSANWMMYRQNNLTDNGWTYLEQNINPNTSTGKHDCTFVVDSKNKLVGAGVYYTKWDLERNPRHMPLGDVTYMKYKDESVMYRVSLDPNPTHHQTYIDIGLYEYQHIELNPDGQDKDILWVSVEEKPKNGPADGSCWERPTSDLQRAIETLLSGRNGRHKEIRIMDGTYNPVYVIGKNLGFSFNTSHHNETLIPVGQSGHIPSFTIQGGWSSELKEVQNAEDYPTVIQLTSRSGIPEENLKTLFKFEDTRQFDVSKQETGEIIPVRMDGLTLVNPYGVQDEGAAVYYQQQLKAADHSVCKAPGHPKLTLSNCVIRQNGKDAKVPAVVIQKGGGRSLVYNSLFHSNAGVSLKNEVDTMYVAHNTFALNGGNVHVENNHSKVSGCVLWNNSLDLAFQNKPELDFTLDPTSGGTTVATPLTYNAVSSKDGKLGDNLKGGFNELLSLENEDIFFGPNFINPKPEAKTFEEISQRDFHLNPSRYLLNKGSIDDHEYWIMVYPGTAKEFFDKQIKIETDLSGHLRKFGTRIDLGAYEYHQPLLRVLYADAQRTMPGDGTSWENAYNRSQLQTAIDMAAIYSASTENDNLQEQAYVYVKSRNDREQSAEELKMRDGVSVYASIPQNYLRSCEYTNEEGVWKYSDQQVEAYEDKVRMERPGIANPDEYTTRVAGIKAEGIYKSQALFDGFEIRGAASDEVKTEVNRPAVEFSGIQNAAGGISETSLPVVLRNAIVHGYKQTAGPVVQIDNGLLYNVLVRDNEVPAGQTVTQIGQLGYAVNATLTGNEGQFVGGAGVPANLLNSISGVPTLPTFNPYLRPGEPKPSYKTVDRNLWYQLTEESAHIDQASSVNNLPAALQGFVNYADDRDLLGNPRQIATTAEAALTAPIDNGCYETWKLGAGTTVEAHVTSGGLPYYPHPASVVYLKQKANLLMAQNGPEGNLPENYIFQPAYLLMGEGASLYGNGAQVKVDYVSTEKSFTPFSGDGKVWAQLALPYDFQTDYLTSRTYNGEVTVETSEKENVTLYTYDGAARAAYDYDYQPDESTLWQELPRELQGQQQVKANEGVLLNLSVGTQPGKIFRFTGISPLANRYVYEENGTPKTVELVQHNYTPKGSAKFTSAENMGWNMFGMPYMVSHYTTGSENEDGMNCPMNFPHMVYGLDEAQGTYLPGESWKAGYEMSMGQGYFSQTATLSDREFVTFEEPVYQAPAQKSTEQLIQVSSLQGTDVVTVRPNDQAEAAMDYQLGADAIKWMALNENAPQIYTFNAEDTRFSLLAAAPEETEIGLGVKAGKAGNYTVSLPDKEVYAEYHAVWLRDNQTGCCTNLLHTDYTLSLDDQEDCKGRLTLQFGGQRPGMNPDGGEGAVYQVYVGGGYLHIDGLHGGEHIAIYNSAGQLVEQAEATDIHYQTRLVQGVYVVKVNRQVYKILY